MMAAGNGHIKIAEFLIKRGANVNAENELASTPLIWACTNGSFDLVKLLFENGAVLDARSIVRGNK